MYRDSGEDGAALVLVAVSMVVLLGAVALSVDVGRIYQERRELQNGADAAALAVAHDCAAGDCGASETTADEYADANASDGRAGVAAVTINQGAQRVTVRTLTEDPNGGTTFPMTFAQVVGFNGLTVVAEATVEWDGLKAGSALPILVREALWNDVSPGRLSTLEEVQDGTAPTDRLVTIAHRSEQSGLADPASARFEWLVGSADCSNDVEVGALVEHRPGNPPDADLPSDCDGSALNSVLGSVSLVAFFNGDLDGGSSRKRVVGIGALYVTSIDDCGDSSVCVTGYFIKDYVVDGLLGGADFGVSAIRFVSG
jgi:Flp pilus assembly protein TadG